MSRSSLAAATPRDHVDSEDLSEIKIVRNARKGSSLTGVNLIRAWVPAGLDCATDQYSQWLEP